jgi:hypothetical protein
VTDASVSDVHIFILLMLSGVLMGILASVVSTDWVVLASLGSSHKLLLNDYKLNEYDICATD